MRKRTRERVNYHRHDSINPVIPSEFNAGKEQQGIETTNTRYKNSSSYGHLKEHKTISGSKDIQNIVTKQSFTTLQKLQEDD